jgi:hypothetical protein
MGIPSTVTVGSRKDRVLPVRRELTVLPHRDCRSRRSIAERRMTNLPALLLPTIPASGLECPTQVYGYVAERCAWRSKKCETKSTPAMDCIFGRSGL